MLKYLMKDVVGLMLLNQHVRNLFCIAVILVYTLFTYFVV